MAAPAATNAAPNKEEDPKDQDKKRLYVRWEVTDDTLKKAFEKFGAITETRVVRGPRLRAFGFLTFESEAAAAAAKAEMEGKSIPAGPLEIQYASAAGALRARDKKERKPRSPADGKSAAADAKDAKSGEAKRGGRAARGAKANGTAAPAKGAAAAGAAAPAGEGKRGRKSRRGGRARGGAAGAAGEAPAAGAAGDAKRDSKRDDPNWGKVVRLVPDPIKTPLDASAQLVELQAGQRAYKAGRTDAKQIASLVLNADPTKGPFNCSFQLGSFTLKLLEVKVSSREGQSAAGTPEKDVRVGCRVVHPDSNRSREVYLRVKGNENKHKFLELRLPVVKPADGKEADLPEMVESFFVTIDSIVLDLKTSLWKKIMLSLVSMMVPRVSPARAAAADAKAPAK